MIKEVVRFLTFKNLVLFLRSPILHLFLISVFFLVVQFIFLRNYSVNLVFMDEVDTYRKVINGYYLDDALLFFHGPHKLGFLFFIEAFILLISRFDSFWIEILYLIYLTAGLILFYLYFVKNYSYYNYIFLVFPILIFSLKQWESILSTRVLSHSAAPLFLVLFLTFLTSTRMRKLYYVVIFTLITTGYGYFYVMALCCARTLLTIKHTGIKSIPTLKRLLEMLAVLMIAILPFPLEMSQQLKTDWSNVPHFASIMVGNWFNLFSFFSIQLSGIIGLLIIVYVLIDSSIKIYQAKSASIENKFKIILMLCGGSFLFIISVAISRSNLDIGAAYPSRYAVYFIPAALGSVLWLANHYKVRKFSLFYFIVFLIFLVNEVLSYSQVKYFAGLDYYRKTTWRNCYVQEKSVNYCNGITNNILYPPENDDNNFKNLLIYFENNKLNLFKE